MDRGGNWSDSIVGLGGFALPVGEQRRFDHHQGEMGLGLGVVIGDTEVTGWSGLQ